MGGRSGWFRKAVIILTVICTLAATCVIGLYVYYLLNTKLSIAESASGAYILHLNDENNRSRFETDRVLLANQAVRGSVFREDIPADEEGYEYVLYTVRVKNNNLTEARTVEMNIDATEGDILFYMPQEEEIVLSPGEEKDINAFLLRKKSTASATRTVYVTYRFFGKPFRMRCTCSELR